MLCGFNIYALVSPWALGSDVPPASGVQNWRFSRFDCGWRSLRSFCVLGSIPGGSLVFALRQQIEAKTHIPQNGNPTPSRKLPAKGGCAGVVRGLCGRFRSILPFPFVFCRGAPTHPDSANTHSGAIPPHSQLVIPFSRWLWQTAARERCFVFSQLLGLPRVQTCVMGCRFRLGSFDPCFALAL